MTPFDALLEDVLSGRMKQKMEAIDVKKIAIYIDWLPEYQCINLSGVHRRNQLDLQIEPSAFHIGCDPDEPDEHQFYPLNSAEQLYSIVQQIQNP